MRRISEIGNRYRAGRMAGLLAVSLAVGLVGCGKFESRSIVLDLRVLAMTVEPPEIMVPLDPAAPQNIALADVEVCALVADPADSRSLTYELVACAPTSTRRCDQSDRLVVALGAGTVPDPEEAGAPVQMCATLPSTSVVLGVLLEEREELGSDEALLGWLIGNGGNLDIQVHLSVRGADAAEDTTQHAAKRMRYALPLPAARVANTNPWIDDLQALVDGTGEIVSMPAGRCGDVEPGIEPLVVGPGAVIEFEPVEAEGVREDYVVPTFDGDERMFTENLTYSWYATHGSWQRQVSGGPKDIAGNEPPLDSEWTAPDDPAELGDGLDVSIWVVQRDERGGLYWRETCVHVAP